MPFTEFTLLLRKANCDDKSATAKTELFSHSASSSAALCSPLMLLVRLLSFFFSFVFPGMFADVKRNFKFRVYCVADER